MPKIRHEINLLTSTYTLANVALTPIPEGAFYDSGLHDFDATKTIYWESLGSATAGSTGLLHLRDNSGNEIAGINISSFGAIDTLVRATVTMPDLASFRNLRVAAEAAGTGKTLILKMSRIVTIVDQTTPIARTGAVIEIGSKTTSLATAFPTGAGASNMTSPKYWKYDASKWDGGLLFTLEGVLTSAASKTACQLQLQVADGTGDGFTGWANVANGNLSSLVTTVTQTARTSIPFTPIDGRWYRVVCLSPTSKTASIFYNAKILVTQVQGARIQVFNPLDSGGQTYIAFAGNGSGANTAVGQSFTPTASFSMGSIWFMLHSFNGAGGFPADSVYVDIRSVSFTGTILATSASVLGSAIPAYSQNRWVQFVFATPLALTSGTKYFAVLERTGPGDTNAYYGAYECGGAATPDPYTGGAAQIRGLTWGGDLTNTDFYFNVCEAGAASITKTQEQYLLSNLLPTGTALQKFLTKWDSTEWSGVANTYTFQANAANGSVSAIQLRTADDATLVATVTSPDNAGTGVATMPASTNLDVKATTNNNDLYAARITVDVVISTAPTSSIKAVETVAYASIGKISGLASASISKVGGLA